MAGNARAAIAHFDTELVAGRIVQAPAGADIHRPGGCVFEGITDQILQNRIEQLPVSQDTGMAALTGVGTVQTDAFAARLLTKQGLQIRKY